MAVPKKMLSYRPRFEIAGSPADWAPEHRGRFAEQTRADVEERARSGQRVREAQPDW